MRLSTLLHARLFVAALQCGDRGEQEGRLFPDLGHVVCTTILYHGRGQKIISNGSGYPEHPLAMAPVTRVSADELLVAVVLCGLGREMVSEGDGDVVWRGTA